MRGVPISYLDYSGGRNTQSAPYLLTESQARDTLNVHTSLSGDIEKRPGFVTHSGATLTGEPAKATLVHSIHPANTSTKSLILGVRTATTDSLVKMTTGGVASNLKTGLTANKLWYWAQAEVSGASGPMFGMNGTDTPQRWDGSAASTSDWVATTGTVPKEGRFLTYFSSRLWCAVGSRLLYSGLTGSSPDPLSWDANNYVDLEPNDGQAITGIGVVGSYLVVFKPRKTYSVYDPVTGANRQVSNQIGCVSHRSIAQTPAGLFFLSEDQGICTTDGSTAKSFSEVIEPDLAKVAANPTTQVLAAGTLKGSRYYLSVSLEGTRNDHTLEYDLETKSWWLHDCAVNQFALLDPAGTPVLYSADSTTTARVSKAFVEGVYTDNGAVYKGGAFWTAPWYAWAVGGGRVNPHVNKRVNEIRVDGVGNWDSYVATDFEDNFEEMEGEVWQAASDVDTSGEWGGTELWGGEETTWGLNTETPVDRRFYTPALARAVSIKFVNEDEANFVVNSTTFLVTPRSD